MTTKEWAIVPFPKPNSGISVPSPITLHPTIMCSARYNDEPLLAKALVVNFELVGSCQGGGQRLSLLPVPTSPEHYHLPPTHRPTTNMWEQRFWGWGRSRATLLGLRGGFKLIWGRLPFIFPTELSFSSDQEPLSSCSDCRNWGVQSKCQRSEAMECLPHPVV